MHLCPDDGMRQSSELVIAPAACFVRAMEALGRATRGLSALVRAALLMLLANLCVAGMTATRPPVRRGG
jgi:hypothetical protein